MPLCTHIPILFFLKKCHLSLSSLDCLHLFLAVLSLCCFSWGFGVCLGWRGVLGTSLVGSWWSRSSESAAECLNCCVSFSGFLIIRSCPSLHVLWWYFPGWAYLVLCGALDQILPTCHEKCRSSEPLAWVAFQPLTQGLSPRDSRITFWLLFWPRRRARAHRLSSQEYWTFSLIFPTVCRAWFRAASGLSKITSIFSPCLLCILYECVLITIDIKFIPQETKPTFSTLLRLQFYDVFSLQVKSIEINLSSFFCTMSWWGPAAMVGPPLQGALPGPTQGFVSPKLTVDLLLLKVMLNHISGRPKKIPNCPGTRVDSAVLWCCLLLAHISN